MGEEGYSHSIRTQVETNRITYSNGIASDIFPFC